MKNYFLCPRHYEESTKIFIGKLPGKKLPVLGVYDDENDCVDKVASFDSENAAIFFKDVLAEMLDAVIFIAAKY